MRSNLYNFPILPFHAEQLQMQMFSFLCFQKAIVVFLKENLSSFTSTFCTIYKNCLLSTTIQSIEIITPHQKTSTILFVYTAYFITELYISIAALELQEEVRVGEDQVSVSIFVPFFPSSDSGFLQYPAGTQSTILLCSSITYQRGKQERQIPNNMTHIDYVTARTYIQEFFSCH